jgi:hypothetical protein
MLFPGYIIIIILTISCTSTRITSSWRDSKRHVHMEELNKVLIVALIENETNRYKAEHQIVKYLKGKGVVSHDYLDANFNERSKEEIMEKIKDDGFDGIVLMYLLDVDKERIYMSDEINNNENGSSNFGAHYLRNHQRYIIQGPYITTKTYILETIIFSLKENKIIWSGITETFEPSGIKKMTNEISRVIYKQMIAEGFIVE